MTDQARIGFDALFLEQPKTGSGRYALNLWRQLQCLVEPEYLSLLAPANAEESVTEAARGRVNMVKVPPLRGRPRKLWWEQFGLPQAVKNCAPPLDIVHVPYFSAPAIQSVPYVITIHDVIPLVVPEYAGSHAMRVYMQLVRRTARRASLVLTDSEYSRQEIIRKLDVPPERVRSISLAVDSQFSPAETEDDRRELECLRKRYGIDGPYIVNTGGLDVRKNVASVIEGFALAQATSPSNMDLVIVGRAHTGNERMYPPLERLVLRLGVAERVKFVGAVEDEEFVALYRGAEMFVFASTYEGFGLTPLEAMACGTPVVSSGATSLAEVVGDAGLVIDPTSRGVATGIVKLSGDPTLRSELAQKGLERARTYSWRTTAERTLEAYDDVRRYALA